MRLLLWLMALSGSLLAASDSEKPRRPNRPMNYFEAQYWAERTWREDRPVGRTYEDAKKAFALNTYYASEIVAQFDLTPDQEFEFALMTAREKGAVFTNLIRYYPRLTEHQRYKAALVAARYNNWANVKFDIDAVGISDPVFRRRLIQVALLKSYFQLNSLGEWNLPRAEVFKLLKLSANRHGLHFMNHLSLLGKVTSAETLELLLDAVKGQYDFDVASSFEKSWLPNSRHRFTLAWEIAGKCKYFVEHMPRFGIASVDKRRALVNRNLMVRETRLLSHPLLMERSDSEILNAYFQLRDRDNVGRPNIPGTDIFFSEWHDPIRLIEKIGKLHIPDMERPGYAAHNMPSLRLEWTDGTGRQVYDGEAERLARANNESVDDLISFSQVHPDLLPRHWVDTAYRSYGKRVMAGELIRQCYRLSREGDLLQPRNSLDITCRAAGLECGEWTPESYSRVDGWNLHVHLLSLMHMFPKPAFFGIDVEPALLAPENVPIFIRFLKELRARIHWDSANADVYEWDAFLRLRYRLRLEEKGIKKEGLDWLIETLRKRPRVRDHKNLPRGCETLIAEN